MIMTRRFPHNELTECPVGLYGANCEEFCSSNCREERVCDKVTGHCEGGCQAGWTQPKCDLSMYVLLVATFNAM